MTDATAPQPLAKRPASTLVNRIWRRSGLSQAELARRAGLPRSALSVYVHGRRRPRADVLLRIAAAAGFDLEIAPRVPPVDTEQAARRLVQVLELAEALPFRPREKLGYPKLTTLLPIR